MITKVDGMCKESLIEEDIVCLVSEDDEEVSFEYTSVIKAKCYTKNFSLNKGELKFIVDSLEDFSKSINALLGDEELTAYKRAILNNKLKQCTKISDNIKKEINYCSKCNKKEREETGFSGLEASVNGIK